MRILVCGWTDSDMIREKLEEYDSKSVIITGGCRGADKLADRIGKQLRMKTEVFEADWKTYGLSAGPIRC